MHDCANQWAVLHILVMAQCRHEFTSSGCWQQVLRHGQFDGQSLACRLLPSACRESRAFWDWRHVARR